MTELTAELPNVRGNLTLNRPLAELSWLRTGGPAEVLFQPADTADLQDFLRALPPYRPVFPIGVCSNLIIRDGGIRGVVVRLGRAASTGSKSRGHRSGPGLPRSMPMWQGVRRRRDWTSPFCARSQGPSAGPAG